MIASHGQKDVEIPFGCLVIVSILMREREMILEEKYRLADLKSCKPDGKSTAAEELVLEEDILKLCSLETTVAIAEDELEEVQIVALSNLDLADTLFWTGGLFGLMGLAGWLRQETPLSDSVGIKNQRRAI